MKKTIFAFAALPAALALGACGETATEEAADNEMATDTMEAPVDDTMATDGTMMEGDGTMMEDGTMEEDGAMTDDTMSDEMETESEM